MKPKFIIKPSFVVGKVQDASESGITDGLMGLDDEEERQFDESERGGSWQVIEHKYAVFETTLATLGDTFNQIYSSWFPTSGYQEVAGVFFECDGQTFDPDDPTSVFAIYIPVIKINITSTKLVGKENE